MPSIAILKLSHQTQVARSGSDILETAGEDNILSYFEQQEAKLGSLTKEIRSTAAKGGLAVGVAYGCTFVLQVLSEFAVVRFLQPEDVGRVTMVMAALLLAFQLKDVGLSTPTIQVAKLTEQQVSSLFWINLIVGATGAILIITLAPLISWFYKEDSLTPMVIVLGPSFLIAVAGVQHTALLIRWKRFKETAFIQVLSAFVGLIVGLLVAIQTGSAWALLVMFITRTSTQTIASFWRCPWVPRRLAFNESVKDLLLCGRNVAAFDVLNYCARNLDKIIIGRLWGPDLLALYSKAYQLVQIPVSQIRTPLLTVGLSTLSTISSNSKAFKRLYLGFVDAIATCSVPILIWLAVFGELLFAVVLGRQWIGAAEPLRILAVGALLQASMGSMGTLMIARGRSADYLRWGGIHSIILVTAFVIGVRWGILGVSWAFVLGHWIFLFLTHPFVLRGTDISFKDFMQVHASPTAFSLVAVAIANESASSLSSRAEPLQLVVSFTVMFCAYSTQLLLPSRRNRLRALFRFVRSRELN